MKRITTLAAVLVWSTSHSRRIAPSPWPRRRRRNSRACSVICCRCSRRRPGIEVKVVAVGTGQALDIGRRGDADVVFVHDRPAEEKFMSEGHGVKRFDVMYNDFVIVGPKSDPGEDRRRQGRHRGAAQDRGGEGALHLARRQVRHACGRAAAIGRRRASISVPARTAGIARSARAWAPALNMASSSNAYLLSDRGTWLSFKNRGELADPDRRRQAAVQPVRRHAGQSGEASEREGEGRPGLHRLAGLAEGQDAIAGYKVGGEQLFFPNASH